MKTITAYATEMNDFLNESDLTQRRAFIESFVKEIVVRPGNAVVRYSIPMPEDSRIPGRVAEEVALHGPVLSTVKYGGAGGDRTLYLFNAIEALSQVSYSPTAGFYDSKGRVYVASLTRIEAVLGSGGRVRVMDLQ